MLFVMLEIEKFNKVVSFQIILQFRLSLVRPSVIM
jgi:hypothetical protein